MTDPLLEEVYQAREKLWQRGGGTMRGVCEYLRECGRRAKERGVLWIESEEEREAIGAEVRARLAKEEAMGAVCVGEGREAYGVADGAATGRTPMNGQTGQRDNDFAMQRANDATNEVKA